MSPRVAPLDGSARMAAQVQGRGEASAEDYGKTFSVNHIATTHDFTPQKSIGYKKQCLRFQQTCRLRKGSNLLTNWSMYGL